MTIRDIIAAQSAAIEPEAFQSAIVEGMTRALLRESTPPCLLRAPTGSGKTFIISRVLESVSAARPTLWLWFVPFVNLVQQTEDALAANCAGLIPVMLSRGRNQDARPGMVLLSTAQGVAKATDRKTGYNSNADDDTRTLAEFVARARVQGLSIGLVVDEAHIGLDKTTEFGKFANWLNADFLIMATATPKDERLLEFLNAAGKSAYENFAASRDEVVNARLNKRYIEAVVYDLRQSVQTVADLKRTVLRQAWKRSQRIKRQLQAAGVALTPLLLVQVGNGDKTVEEAEQDLIKLCGVHPALIGKHSSDDPDPVLMAAIANDSSKEVLIFKQSAGTGFDAPRAFVLASTKSVNDADFAMQFIGRVMRVSRPIREAYPKPMQIPPDLDTAYVYLANAEAQRGFEAAVQASSAVKSQLEGQTEKLLVRQTESGAVVLTNRGTLQTPLMYDLPLPESKMGTDIPAHAPLAPTTVGPQQSLFGNLPGEADDGYKLDEVLFAIDEGLAAPAVTAVSRKHDAPRSKAELLELLNVKGIRTYPLHMNIRNLPRALKREQRPVMQDMNKVSEAVATRLAISDELKRSAVRAALNRLKEKEVHTELTEGVRHEEEVLMITDRNALAREAKAILYNLPQVEDEDVRIIVGVLAGRLCGWIAEEFEYLDDESRPQEAELTRYARDAAYWVIRREAQDITELMQSIVAEFTTLEDAAPLPDLMVFPAALSLAASRKNIYGVMPPSEDDLAKIETLLVLDEREWLADRQMMLAGSALSIGKYDNLLKLNGEEREFAKALDRADFVEWWHRNPDRKPYAVRLVRGEHQNYFHPDFVVCLSHVPNDAPVIRLIETKENTKDAARKARRIPKCYGKVLFLTKDQSRLRVVNDDGSLGETVDWDDLLPVQEWLRASKPTAQ
ncbi:MAG: DEAD/DEAH box helicase [Gallionellales bacterium RIFCSPLOWO2_12_FULL_59_22]|nr:MAG: DEAD/DEAH box helicase [Gallionellales bacterium RIFCSPLOWO2_02_FULL_59_110]OGT05044.1 MAG: DEAD/DEAH box helicase [Gallionellales bacterium RIFCSPLOWO2_02_58_13]OGT12534.1 MAG: DEAD/DEAH box helicase [Gallionellales bacterium RIFCSPLOWO2_12_FULL_59_22]